MSIPVSPGVFSSELDQTLSTGATVSTTDGALVGLFKWGPIEDLLLVDSESTLVKSFGPPDNATAGYWFTASNFLTYGNSLRIARAADANSALNATANAAQRTGSANVVGTVVTGTGTQFVQELSVGQTITINSVAVVVNSITNATSLTVTSSAANGAGGNVFSYGVLIKNDTVYLNSFQTSGNAAYGPWVAKFAGDLGNAIKISVCPSANAFASTLTGTVRITANGNIVTGSGSNFTAQLTAGDFVLVDSEQRQVATVTNSTSFITTSVFANAHTASTVNRTWEFNSQFTSAPGTSVYGQSRNALADELHVVVVDATGAWTGTPGTVLETYAFVSKASDAKDINGNNNYYKNVINGDSAYVRWMSHIPNNTNWGSTIAGIAFGTPYQPVTQTLVSGVDGTLTADDSDILRAAALFSNPEQVSVSLFPTGPASQVVVTSLIALAESRGDCVVFVSPLQQNVINNAGHEADDIVTFRNTLPSSTYAVLDSGWMYMFDKYNDTFRYVPLNGAIAGLAARTDTVAEPWFSPAGFNRGQIANVVKLAFNPNPAERDELYKAGVNPVVRFPGQGTVLYGDKTLSSRTSAFDRINVRRLFIYVRKTISNAAQNLLFEQNDAFTRSQFINLVDPFLRDVKSLRGIANYKIVCDTTNNTDSIVQNHQFVGDIYIQPVYSINYIILNFVATNSTVAFNESQGTVGQ